MFSRNLVNSISTSTGTDIAEPPDYELDACNRSPLMSLTTVLIVIVTFSVVINHVLKRWSRQLPFISGVEYLVLGVAVGPLGAGLLSLEVVETLQPVISLTMGLVGFVLGLPLRHRFRHASTVTAGFVTSLLVAVAVAGALYATLRWLVAPHIPSAWLWLSLAVGAAAATLSAPLIDSCIRQFGARGQVTELLRSHVVAANVVGVTVAGAALAVSRAHQAAESLRLTETEWLVASVGLGLACGVIFSIFLGKDAEETRDRTFLATVGIVIFTSGLAVAIGVSPLLLNAIAGLVTSFLYRHADRLHDTLLTLQGPAFTLLLIFAGAMWRPPFAVVWYLPLIYVVVRVIALYGASTLSVRMVSESLRPPRFGRGLVAQGALAAAIVMNFSQVNPELASLALTAVLPALALSAPVSPYLIRSALADAGDLGRIDDNSGAVVEGERE